jgi:hypothetical protein
VNTGSGAEKMAEIEMVEEKDQNEMPLPQVPLV